MNTTILVLVYPAWRRIENRLRVAACIDRLTSRLLHSLRISATFSADPSGNCFMQRLRMRDLPLRVWSTAEDNGTGMRCEVKQCDREELYASSIWRRQDAAL